MNQKHRIAEMLMSADNRVSHYGQPHMLHNHGSGFHLQGYSNPYDYPSTLGAGHHMEGGINWTKIGNHFVSGIGKAVPSLAKMGLSYVGMGRSGGRRGRPRKHHMAHMEGAGFWGDLGKIATGAIEKVAPRLIDAGLNYAIGGARPHISHLTPHEIQLLNNLEEHELHALHGAGFWGDLGKIATGALEKVAPTLIDAGLNYAMGGARSGGRRGRPRKQQMVHPALQGAGFWGDLGKIATGAIEKVAPRLIDAGLNYAIGGVRPHISHLTPHEIQLLNNLEEHELHALHGAGFWGDLGKIATGALEKVAPTLIDAGLNYAMGGARSGGRLPTSTRYPLKSENITRYADGSTLSYNKNGKLVLTKSGGRRGRPRKHHMAHMEGAGFWKNVGNGFKKAGDVFKPIIGVNPVNMIEGGYKWGEQLGEQLAGGARSGGRRGRPRKHHMAHMEGAGFWGDLGKIATGAIEKVAPTLIDAGLNYAMGGARSGGRATLPKSGKLRNTARGDIVKAIMTQRGVNLPTASRIVKEEGLY